MWHGLYIAFIRRCLNLYKMHIFLIIESINHLQSNRYFTYIKSSLHHQPMPRQAYIRDKSFHQSLNTEVTNIHNTDQYMSISQSYHQQDQNPRLIHIIRFHPYGSELYNHDSLRRCCFKYILFNHIEDDILAQINLNVHQSSFYLLNVTGNCHTPSLSFQYQDSLLPQIQLNQQNLVNYRCNLNDLMMCRCPPSKSLLHQLDHQSLLHQMVHQVDPIAPHRILLQLCSRPMSTLTHSLVQKIPGYTCILQTLRIVRHWVHNHCNMINLYCKCCPHNQLLINFPNHHISLLRIRSIRVLYTELVHLQDLEEIEVNTTLFIISVLGSAEKIIHFKIQLQIFIAKPN